MRIVKKTDDKIWFGGYGNDPYVYVVEKGTEDKFLGGVFLVESEAELEKYSTMLVLKSLTDYIIFKELQKSLAQERLSCS